MQKVVILESIDPETESLWAYSTVRLTAGDVAENFAFPIVASPLIVRFFTSPTCASCAAVSRISISVLSAAIFAAAAVTPFGRFWNERAISAASAGLRLTVALTLSWPPLLQLAVPSR